MFSEVRVATKQYYQQYYDVMTYRYILLKTAHCPSKERLET